MPCLGEGYRVLMLHASAGNESIHPLLLNLVLKRSVHQQFTRVCIKSFVWTNHVASHQPMHWVTHHFFFNNSDFAAIRNALQDSVTRVTVYSRTPFDETLPESCSLSWKKLRCVNRCPSFVDNFIVLSQLNQSHALPLCKIQHVMAEKFDNLEEHLEKFVENIRQFGIIVSDFQPSSQTGLNQKLWVVILLVLIRI